MSSRIEVTDYNRELARETISLLYDIKVVLGPTALNGTLSKHPKVKEYLKTHFAHAIIELEREI